MLESSVLDGADTPTVDLTIEEKRALLRERLAARRDRPGAAYTSAVNPRLAALMRGIGIDVAYVRGEGAELVDADGERYLDFAGAYGALPFGHNPPEIWDALDGVRAAATPSLVQPSLLDNAGRLAQRLLEVAPPGLDHVWLCNSGAEAVEGALKLVRAAGARPVILGTKDGFHGKTLGALSVTGRPQYQTPFGAPAGGFDHVPFGDIDALRTRIRELGDQLAAFVVEPVQGEGGVRVPPPGYLAAAREACDEVGAWLVVDEVQTGLGRTGTMFACERDGITPDVLTVAKALGGGVVPIGATLFRRELATDDFTLRHTSTFGGNGVSAAVGLRSLEILTDPHRDLLGHVRARSAQLRTGLEQLANRYRRVASDVRGEGLLLGLELSDDPADYPDQGMIRSLAEQGALAGVLCGYLLQREQIRLAPTYFAGRVLRVEPPLTITEAQCEVFLAAVGRALEVLSRGDTTTLLGHLLPEDAVVEPAAADTVEVAGQRAATNGVAAWTPTPPPALADRARLVGTPRWAFIAHPTDLASYTSFDRALKVDGHSIERLFDRLDQARTPDSPATMLMGSCVVEATDGRQRAGEILTLSSNARALLDLPRNEAVDLVQRAVDEAVERGAEVVGLGAYTSIVTANATLLDSRGARLTTGNGYTVASAVDGLLGMARRRGVDPAGATAVVVGAAGAIGRASALALSQDVAAMRLVGNPARPDASLRRLSLVAEAIVEHLAQLGSDGRGELARTVAQLRDEGETARTTVELLRITGQLELSVDQAASLRDGQLVLVATSSPQSLVRGEDLAPAAIVCDVSQPPNVDPAELVERPDVTAFSGGMISLPGGRPLQVDLGTAAGTTFACTAETIISAFADEPSLASMGQELSMDTVHRLRVLGRRLGFGLDLHVDAARMQVLV